MQFIYRALILFIFANLFFAVKTDSQILSKIGFKFGFSLNGISTFNDRSPVDEKGIPNTFIHDSSSYFDHFSADVSLYAELFNTANFCLSTELHYITRGEGITRYTLQRGIETGLLEDNQNYISLQLLPRIRAGLSGKYDNLYFFAGPTFDFPVSKNNHYTNEKYVFSPSPCEIGAAMGGGFEVIGAITLEIKYFIDITGPYDFTYKNDVVKRRYSSLMFLAAYTFFDRTN